MKFDIKTAANKSRLAVMKHSPEILVITGIVGVVTSAVMACKATRKLDPVLEAHKKNAEEVHRKFTDEKLEKRELTKVYMKTGISFVKLYGPSVTVGMLSITGILASNNILRRRNVAQRGAGGGLYGNRHQLPAVSRPGGGALRRGGRQGAPHRRAPGKDRRDRDG